MQPRLKDFLLNALLVCGSLLLSWIAIELVVWQFFPAKRDKILANMISADRRGTLTDGFFKNFYTYDATYGWLPKTNFEGQKWGHTVALLDRGVRSNGSGGTKPPERPLVLAVGDSYTFGDEEADHDTWPAIFEREHGVRVLNAGVSSFGVDQIVMRAEELAAVYQPDLIAVSFITNSHERAGYAVRHGAYKPYYDLVDGELMLRNVPVPQQDRVDWFRYILGHSYVLHFPMHNFATQWWWRGAMWDFRLAGNDPVAVSCRLVQRLRDFASARNIALTFFFMVEAVDSRNEASFPAFRECVKALSGPGVSVFDSQSVYVDLYGRDPSQHVRLRNRAPDNHFTPEGNALMANLEAEAILPMLKMRQRPGGSEAK